MVAGSPARWAGWAGSAAAQALAVGLARPESTDAAERSVAWWNADPQQRHWLTLADPRYPAPLLQLADPPFLLYAEGDLACLARPMLAIVGSRHATAQGLDHAENFARHLSQSGWCVVSGLAAGIDGAAHQGALQGPGRTIAVVGTGLDRVYPASHRLLARRILDTGGLMLSEFVPGSPPRASHFPQRNRVIAGLSRGTLVVEAAPKSGSLITARMALDANREVFAIPGSIHSPHSRGCHQLIKQGAKLVETAQDILEEWPEGVAPSGRPVPAPAPVATDIPSRSAAANPILEALGYDPTGLEPLAARLGWPPALLQAELLALELSGQVARLPGGRYQRVGRA